jgi:electron transport complex protein RnfG
VVVLVATGLLSFTYSITAEEIERQQYAQFEGYLQEMFPGMQDVDIEDEVYVIKEDGQTLGYAFVAEGEGYSGQIRIMVGLEDPDTVKGIIIMSQTETPGIGSRILEDSFLSQFAGIDIGKIALRGDGGEVDTITGATISSTTVIEAIREAAAEKLQGLVN